MAGNISRTSSRSNFSLLLKISDQSKKKSKKNGSSKTDNLPGHSRDLKEERVSCKVLSKLLLKQDILHAIHPSCKFLQGVSFQSSTRDLGVC